MPSSWAHSKALATVRDLKDYGFDAKWLHKYLELSGPRGVDYAPPDMTSVHGYRWVLHVTLPKLEPASKRRRV